MLDLYLPKRDGWQVLTELKGDPATADIPVAIVTVTEDRRPASALGVQEFFVKPVERDEFLRRLRGLRGDLLRPGRSARVLVVDDDPAVRKLVGDMLRAEGAEVTEAGGGREAVEYLAREAPDLIVLDLMMPDTDGFAVVESVRARPGMEAVPILVVTSKDVTPEDRKLLNGRTQALLHKHLLTPDRLHGHLKALGLIQ